MVKGETRAIPKPRVGLARKDWKREASEQEIARRNIVKALQSDLDTDTDVNKIEETM